MTPLVNVTPWMSFGNRFEIIKSLDQNAAWSQRHPNSTPRRGHQPARHRQRRSAPCRTMAHRASTFAPCRLEVPR
jgi:hypothetical protein